MLVGIYARYSDPKQRLESIADQFRGCRVKADREGWQTFKEYSDPAISGKTFFLRPGIQAM